MKIKYKKVPNNENVIEIDGKVILSFDPRYKEYLKWRDENPDLEQQLSGDIEQEIENKRLYKLGAPHKEGNVWKWYNEDGQLILESIISTDEKNPEDFDWEVDGEYVSWYSNGQKKSGGKVLNGKQEGLWVSWDEDGNKKSEGIYVEGKEGGEWGYWYKNGQKKLEGNYRNGDGSYPDYFDGLPDWKNETPPFGGRNGKWTGWHENGQKKLEKTFKDGEVISTTKEWNEDGTVKN